MVATAETINDFYAEFWGSGEWSSAEPNHDERLRAAAITRLIEEFAIPTAEPGSLKILDLGCGRGWLTSLLSSYGSVLGIDPVPAAIDRAKVLFPHLNVRVAGTADLLGEGFASQFDLIVSSEVIEHIPDEQKELFVRDIHNLLKPGGYAVLTSPRGELLKLWTRNFRPAQPIEEWISEDKLDDLCERQLLRIVKRERVFLPYCPFDWISRIAANNTWMRYVGLQQALRRYRAIYQVVLLTRPQP